MFRSSIPKPKYRLIKHTIPVYGEDVKAKVYWTIEKRSWLGLWHTWEYHDDPWSDHSEFNSREDAEKMLAYYNRTPKKEVVEEYYED